MSTHCGSTTEEENAVCMPAACSCSPEQKDEQPIQLSLPKNTFSIKQFLLGLKKICSSSEKEKNYVEKNS